MKYFLFVVFSILITVAQAQYAANYNITGMQGTITLQHPWAGGLNNPQFSAADLDHDGTNDLVVFDRTGDRVLTFRNNGAAYPDNYDYAPQFEANFPSMDSWCLLLDFNCDNVPDIFTHTTLGIRVYKGFYDSNNYLDFSLYKPLVQYQSTSGVLNLLVTSVDIPGIADVNNDGDIDVITFDSGGSQEQYFENQSQENGWNCDSLSYVLEDQCWGHFYEGTILPKYLDTCLYGGMILQPDNANTRDEHYRHTGSTTLIFDNTGDGVKEAFIGDISYNEITYLVNDGTVDDAHMVSQDTMFPSYDVPAHVPYFPGAFRLDVNNDGKLDLLMAPNAEDATLSNGSACAWFYQNTGSNNIGNFDYVIDSFLVKEMFDVGHGCTPAWFDYDNDGLTDLLLANYRYFDTCSYIATLKNIGTTTAPAFRLTKRNYVSLASLNKTGLYPTFGDLDDDNDDDMILGNEDGTLLFYQNNAPAGNPAQFSLTQTNYFGIDVGGNSAPQLFDVNADGLLDLIIGKANGKLEYYENQGTLSTPDFSIVTNAIFGGVGVGTTALDACSTPCMTNLPGYNGLVLLVGNKFGQVQLFDNIEGNISGTFNLVTNNYSGIRGGKRTSIAAKDINGDGVVELAIGNFRGGVTIYDTASSISVKTFAFAKNQVLKVYPNPASNRLYVSCENGFAKSNFELITTDALGRNLNSRFVKIDANTAVIDVLGFHPGIYFTRLIYDSRQAVCRWIKTE